jgi:hypothetical protein
MINYPISFQHLSQDSWAEAEEIMTATSRLISEFCALVATFRLEQPHAPPGAVLTHPALEAKLAMLDRRIREEITRLCKLTGDQTPMQLLKKLDAIYRHPPRGSLQ